jgi:hypothetical protein
MIHESSLLGVVDIWKCRKCANLFVDEKRFTDEKTSTDVGIKDAREGSKWGVLLCLHDKQLSWELLSIKPGDTLSHQCVSPTPSHIVVNGDFSVSSNDLSTLHKVLLVEDHVNQAVELDNLLSV